MVNLGKILNKKAVFIFAIILILGAGGFFLWQEREIKGSPDDYIIKEITDGKIVENKKAGLSVKVPEGWEVEKIEAEEGSVAFYFPNTEGEQRNEIVSPPLKNGCIIEISVVYKKMNFEEIEKEVRAIHWGLRIKSEEFEEVTVNNRSALKNTFDSGVLGSAIIVYIPSRNKLYDFDLYWALDEKEKCIQEFDKFLETASID
ncbi:MAG: hypothetical protein Q7S82_00155 [bacterium]|nr:hypothetical protein [bacterium]